MIYRDFTGEGRKEGRKEGRLASFWLIGPALEYIIQVISYHTKLANIPVSPAQVDIFGVPPGKSPESDERSIFIEDLKCGGRGRSATWIYYQGGDIYELQ